MPAPSEKLWPVHVVASEPGGVDLLYIDRMLLHEVSSPQAFAGLRAAGRPRHTPALGRVTPVADTWIVARTYDPFHYAVDEAVYRFNPYEAAESTVRQGCAEAGFLRNARASIDEHR